MVISNPKSPSNNHSPTSAPSSAPSGDSNSPNFTRKTFPSPWAQVVRGGETVSANGIHPSAPSSSSSSSSLTTGAADQASSSDCSPKAVATLPPVDNSNTLASVVNSSDGSDSNVGCSKKHAWKKPSTSNGVVEVGPVMGAESWPALSESTLKAAGKLPAESSSKTPADGSISVSQGHVTSHAPQRSGTSNAKANSSTNYNMSNRPRPVRRVGGSNIEPGPTKGSYSNPPPPHGSFSNPLPPQGSFSNPPTPQGSLAQGSLPQGSFSNPPAPQGSFSNPPPAPPPPPFPIRQLPPISYGNIVPPSISNHSPRDHYRNNNWDARPLVGSYVPVINEPRGSSRRGKFGGPHPRGDGSYHHTNYNSRRDHDRGSYVNTRDAHVSQGRMPPRGLLRPPPPSTPPFVGPQPIGPFPGYHELFYFPPVVMDPYMGMSYFPHVPIPSPVPAAEAVPAAEVVPAAEAIPATEAAESSLPNRIINQIDYYFSDKNLVTDNYLKGHMDEQGWVPISLIAEFNRVRRLTTDRQLILNSLAASKVIEVKGDKLRRRDEWMRWLPSIQVQAESSSISPSQSINKNNLTADFQTITLEETIEDQGLADSSDRR